MNAPGEREFKARFDFPTERPTAGNLPWKSINFEQQPEAYIRALLTYGIKDNSDPAIDWRMKTTRGAVGVTRRGFIISASGFMA
jgi:hypothetical protein